MADMPIYISELNKLEFAGAIIMREQLLTLLSEEILSVWNNIIAEIDILYDVDQLWNKGFGDWVIEYKYRRGGKTLCTFYAKKDAANILITYGKVERKKFEELKDTVSVMIQEIYDNTESLHDGKWLWIPIDQNLKIDDVITMLKIKRRPNRK